MAEELDSVTFVTDDGEVIDFFVLDSVKHNDTEYILVTEHPDEEELEVQILRLGEEEPGEDDETVQVFNTIDDPEELKEVGKLFSDIADEDVEISFEE